MTTFVHHGHLRQMLERQAAKRRAVRTVPTLTPSDLRGMATITIHGPVSAEKWARILAQLEANR